MIFNPNVMAAAGGGGGAVVGTYTGDGSSSRTIDFGVAVEMVMIVGQSDNNALQRATAVASSPNDRCFAEQVQVGSSSNQYKTSYLTATFNGTCVTFSGLSGYTLYAINKANITYHYIAIPKA